MHHDEIDLRSIGQNVCGSCHYFVKSAESFTGYRCSNVETKHPPFRFPIVDVRETTVCCEKYWRRHIEQTSMDMSLHRGAVGGSVDVELDKQILKWGGVAALLLFVLGLLRDKLGDVFPAVRKLLPWIFH